MYVKQKKAQMDKYFFANGSCLKSGIIHEWYFVENILPVIQDVH